MFTIIESHKYRIRHDMQARNVYGRRSLFAIKQYFKTILQLRRLSYDTTTSADSAQILIHFNHI